MNPKLKNTIIFLVVGVGLVFGMVYFMGGDESTDFLSSSSDGGSIEGTTKINDDTTRNFLTLLLSVRSIRLDDSIFKEPAFTSLRDSTVMLVPDGNEGRPNPFAPIGSDVAEIPIESLSNPESTSDATPEEGENNTPDEDLSQLDGELESLLGELDE